MTLALCALALCLLPGSLILRWDGFPGSGLRAISAAFSDLGLQWTAFLCAGIYFVVLSLVRHRQMPAQERGLPRAAGWGSAGAGALRLLQTPALCLGSLITLAALDYARDYTQAAQSVQALTLLGAAVIGQAAWFAEARFRGEDQPAGNAPGAVVLAMVVLLFGAAVWQPQTALSYQYRSHARWSGPWDNPNMFGMLMGVGVVLAVGRAGQRLKAKGQRLKSWGREHRTLKLGPWLRRGFFLAAAGVMGVGLVKSYSRGAWVGAAVGVAYLMYQIGKVESRKQKAEMGRGKAEVLKAVRSWLVLAIISVAVGLLAFWSCRHTEWAVARRAYTLANANDFSWRNRVAAYEGALQMLADKPWFGFGWNQPEGVYEHYYRAAKVDEGMAIQLNDYFTLGTTLGVPALLCFLGYVGVSLGRGRKAEVRGQRSEVRGQRLEVENRQSRCMREAWLRAVCRAGAVVLLVGFWFDGGLFKLAAGATFWVLLELGQQESEPVRRV